MDNPILGTKIIRLRGGEDLIADVMEQENGDLTLDNPLHIIFKRSTSGMMMVLLPWLPMELIEENIATIPRNEVLTVVEPKMKMIDYYTNVLETIKLKLMDMNSNPLEYSDDRDESEDSSEETISDEELEAITKTLRVLH